MAYFLYMHMAPNGKVYIGIHKGIRVQDRWGKNGEGYKKHHRHFWAAIQKYGWDNFDHYWWELQTENEMKDCEALMIAFFNARSREYGYNKTAGGEHPNHCDETKAIMSERHSGENNPMYGTHPEPWNKGKKCPQLAQCGKDNPNYGKHPVRSDEAKKHMSDSAQGKHNGEKNGMYGKHPEPWNKGKKGVQDAWNKGKKIGPNPKVAAALTGKKQSDATKAKRSASMKGKSQNKKRYRNKLTGRITTAQGLSKLVNNGNASREEWELITNE